MRECRYKKRLQIYLDGWMDDKEARRLEVHLKRCSDCQTEMVELEEVASAALEIVDQAPDFNYWKNFPARVLNRIISRDVSPYEQKQKSARSLRLKIGSYTVAITALAAATLLIFNYASWSPDVPDAGVRDVVGVADQIAETELAEPTIFTAEESDRPTVNDESKSISAGQPGLPVDEKPLLNMVMNSVVGNEIEEKPTPPSQAEMTSQSDFDLNSAFRRPALFERAPLKLDDDYSFLDRLMTAYSGRAAKSYSISPAVLAERILSGYTFRDINRMDNGIYGPLDIGPFPGLNGDRLSSGWGYLSLPDDTSNTEELRKYLIELELMQAK